MKSINWETFIKIKRTWVNEQLEHHFNEVSDKLNIRLYSFKATGTQILPDAVVEELHFMLPDFVYSAKEILELGERKAAQRANNFFGKKDPKTDGKYGELLLFALVEGVLGCKMVAHKIRTLSNMKDQVKGGDGVFLGNYTIADGRREPAYLIGESKVMGQYSKALEESLDSINRFIEGTNSSEFRSSELLVASENLMKDDDMDVDELYERLNPTSEIHKDQIRVHPILLMYDDTAIKTCEKNNNATRKDLEESIKKAIIEKKSTIIKNLNEKLKEYPNVCQVYLDFFLIPFNDVDKFRDTMYQHVHGLPYSKS